MAQLNLIKTNRLDAVTTLAGKVGLFIDENGIVCKIDEAGTITEVGAALEYASNAEVLARTDSTKVITPATIDGGVKRYKALISQTGTNAPVATILENSLNAIPVWSYENVGSYKLTLNNAFPENKTTIISGTPTWDGGAGFIEGGFNDINSLAFTIRDDAYVPANGLLYNTTIIIEVYP